MTGINNNRDTISIMGSNINCMCGERQYIVEIFTVTIHYQHINVSTKDSINIWMVLMGCQIEMYH